MVLDAEQKGGRRHAAKQAFFDSCQLHRTAYPLQGGTAQGKGTARTGAFGAQVTGPP